MRSLASGQVTRSWCSTNPARWATARDVLLAGRVADQVWAAGCRDPRVAEVRIVQMSRAGREADLRAALADAAIVLKAQAGSTDPAVRSLAVRAAQVDGRLVRLTDPASPRARFARAKRPPRPTRCLRDLPVVH